MKTKAMILSALAMSTLLTVACPNVGHAGGGTVVDGGGGKGVVCYDNKGEISSVETLDLYEGKVDFGYTYKYAFADEMADAIVYRIQQHIEKTGILYTHYQSPSGWYRGRAGDDYSSDAIKNTSKEILEAIGRKEAGWSISNSTINVLENIILNPTKDSYEAFFPKNCKVEQLAVYKDASNNEKLYINYDLYKYMDELNKAALILHEAIYKDFRSSGDKNSLRTRRLVSRLLAGKPINQNIHVKDPNAKWMDCVSSSEILRENSFTFPATVVRLQELNGVVSAWGLYLKGSKVLEPSSYSGSVETFHDIKKHPDSQGGSNLTAGDIEREDEVYYTVSANKKKQITLHVSGRSFTNGAPAFEEDLLCYDLPAKKTK
jgi:hypothetical protein